jgi:hypothetical protein
MNGTIPVSWCLDDIKSVQFKEDYHKDQDLIARYAQSGHDALRMTIYNYWDPSPMPKGINEIRHRFNHLSLVTLAIHRTPPGYYIPLHHDLYGRYKTVNNLDSDCTIQRSIVMLDHSHPGQIFQIDNLVYGEWPAGAVFSWSNDTPHAFYNFSMVDRFAVQITGVAK